MFLFVDVLIPFAVAYVLIFGSDDTLAKNYGVLSCGVLWCGVLWCGVVWCGVVWCGVRCAV